jgi:hypothetical protein
VAVLLAGCSHSAGGGSPQANKAAVEQAYLAWWGARQAAYLVLDPEPLKAYATAAGLVADQQRMADLRGTGHLLRLSAEHGMQTVVYRDGATSSVDDVWVDHSVELDPTTRSPIQPDPGEVVHDATTLRRKGGRWVVDGVVRFGAASALAGQPVSWAAVTGGKALPDFYRKPIEDAYLKAGRPGTEHNDRVAIEQDSVAWVYDTTANGSTVGHSATRLVQEAGAWRIQAAP